MLTALLLSIAACAPAPAPPVDAAQDISGNLGIAAVDERRLAVSYFRDPRVATHVTVYRLDERTPGAAREFMESLTALAALQPGDGIQRFHRDLVRAIAAADPKFAVDFAGDVRGIKMCPPRPEGDPAGLIASLSPAGVLHIVMYGAPFVNARGRGVATPIGSDCTFDPAPD